MTNQVKFTSKIFANAQAAMIAACHGIDTAIKGSENAVNKWAKLAAAGISANSITLDDVKAGIIAAHNGAKTLADCGNTVKGRFYALQRIIDANKADDLLNGESFHTVARSCKAKQEQKKGKRSTSKALATKEKLLSFNDCASGLIHWCNTASANTEKAKELANSPLIMDLLAALAKLDKASQGVAKPAKAKPAQAPAKRKVPSANVTPMKKAA